MSEPIRVLAEDHFGGPFALAAAVACTLMPVLYVAGVLSLRFWRRRQSASYDASDSNIALGLGGVLAIAFGIALVPFWARALIGVTQIGQVTSVEQKRRRDSDVQIFSIRLPDGTTLEESVENEDRPSMTIGRSVLVRGVRGVRGFERLGDGATLSQGTLIGSLAAWGLVIPLSIALARRRKS